MAQSGFTPIQLFRTTTAAAVPTAGSLADGELAINLTDEKLYFKNASGTVKLLASSGGASGTVTSVDVSGGTTGLTFSGGPITSSGTITMAGTLGVANGGTGASSLNSGYLVKGNGTSAVSASVIYDDGTNVGIGTSSPTEKLVLNSAGNVQVATKYINGNTTGVTIGAGADGSAFVYQASALPFIVYTNATQRLTINSSGNVTANVDLRAPIFYDSNDTNYFVNPAGNSTIGNLNVYGPSGLYVSDNAATTSFVQTSTDTITGESYVGGSYSFSLHAGNGSSWVAKGGGQFGVGTNTPSYRLHVNSGAATTVGFFQSTGTSSFIGLSNANYTAYLGSFNDGSFRIQTPGSGFSDKLTVGIAGDVTASVDLRAPIFYDSANTAYYLDPTGSTSLNVAGNMLAAGNVELGNGANRRVRIGSATNYNYDLQTTGDDFQIIEAGTTPRLTIKYPNGYVGIGTTSPSLPLVVSNAGAGGLEFNHSGAIGNGTYIQSYNRSTAAYIPNTNYALSQTWYSGATRAMDLNSSGNLGIGTTSPGAKLHVAGGGNIRLTATSDGSNGVFQVYDSASSTLFQLYNDSTKANLAVVEAKPMVFYTTNTERMRIDASGSVTANVDLRAPIFYDSNDTGYYVNPNSTSNFYYLNVLAVGPNTGSYNYPDAFRIYMADPNWAYGAYSNNSTQYWMQTQFYGVGDDSRGFRVLDKNGDVVRFRVNGAGSAIASADMRAPVFYDSNNTGYYLDPASSGTALVLGGTATMAGGLAVYDGGAGNDPYGKIAVTRSTGGNYTYYALTRAGQMVYGMGIDTSNQFWIGGSTAGYDGVRSGNPYLSLGTAGDVTALASFRAPIFYDSNDTSWYVDPSSSSLVNVVYGSAWYYRVDGNYGFIGANVFADTVNSGYASDPLELCYVRGTGVNIGTGGGNLPIRADIFYEGTNTAYYVDPASTTTSIQVAGAVEQGNNYAHPQIEWSSSSATGMVIFYLPGTTSNYGMVHMVFDIYEYVTGKTATVIIGGHNWSTSWYNTGVQVVGWTDKTVRLGVKNGRFCVIFGGVGSSWTYGTIRLRKIHNASFYDNIMDLGGNWSTELTNTESFTTVTSDLRQLRTSNTFTADGDVRSPIFYDSSNTAYYLDPASTSLLNEVKGYRFYNPQGVSSDDPFGLYFSSDLSTAYAIYRESGAWTHPYPDLRIAFHTGIKMGANASYGGMKFYTDYDMSSQVMSINNSADGVGAGNVFINNVLVAAGDIRSQIFYDSNNTAYYVDPASGSVLGGNVSVLGGRNITLDTSGGSISIRGDAGGWATGSYFLGSSGTNLGGFGGYGGGNSLTYLWAGNAYNNAALYIYAANYAVSPGSLRAPIFYDSDNTAYYVDAAGTSVINSTQFGTTPGSPGNGRVITSPGSPYSIRQEFGTDNSGWRYGIAKNASGTVTVLFYVQDNGDCVATGNVTAYSDIRVKDNVETIPAALAKLSAIRGVTYTRTDLDDKERRYAGVIAQEIEQVLPEAIGGDEHIKTVDYNATIALLIQAVKELSAEVQLLKAKEY